MSHGQVYLVWPLAAFAPIPALLAGAVWGVVMVKRGRPHRLALPLLLLLGAASATLLILAIRTVA